MERRGVVGGEKEEEEEEGFQVILLNLGENLDITMERNRIRPSTGREEEGRGGSTIRGEKGMALPRRVDRGG